MTAKQKLEATLWDIANTLRGKMAADEFRDYIAAHHRISSWQPQATTESTIHA